MKEYKLYIGLSSAKPGFPKKVSKKALLNFLTHNLPAFTLQYTIGFYHGTREHSAVVTIVDTDAAERHIRTAAKDAASAFGQESVLLTVKPVEASLVEIES